MNSSAAKILLAGLAFAIPVTAQEQTAAPAVPSSREALRLVNTFALPKLGPGNFDHFAVDLKRHRLFATPEEAKAVLVMDATSGQVLHEIEGIQRPHAILYRADLDRLYITDGIDGSVRIFDGETYKQLARIPLLKDADAIGYDISTKNLYVANGGKDMHQKSSHISIIDTTPGQKLQDIAVDGETLEAMTLDTYRPRLYINNTAKNTVDVINRYTRTKIAQWPVTNCKDNVAIALDEQRQRLFVGCRSNQIVVMDSNTGKQLQILTIHDGVDDVIYDADSQRIYASTNGYVDVYAQQDLNHYISLGSLPTAEKARTARLVPEWNRLFVAAPQTTSSPARILVFEPRNTPPVPAPKTPASKLISAPYALKIALDELTLHPTLRRIGLHAIPPGDKVMYIIANANETRIGVPTSQGDFDATRGGKTSAPRNSDGEFFNIKMLLLDAQAKEIGILVMEIPWTDAANEAEAAREAENIRSEIAKKIPGVDALFGSKLN
jgi:hypothetical protein